MSDSGRPTKLTPELQKKIVDTIKIGNYVETAAALAGLHKSTLYDWMKRGAREAERLAKNPKLKPRKKEIPYMEFSDALTRAIAYAEARDVQIIAKAAEVDWKASAWRLERRNSERWGRKEKVSADLNHSGEVIDRHEQNHNINVKQEVKHSLKEYDGVIDELLNERRTRNTANISQDTDDDS